MKKILKPKVNIGIVGCGRAAELIYIPALKRFPEIKVAAVVDPVKERRELLSARFEHCSCYSSIVPDFINQIDAAVISTPPDAHISSAAVLLRNNKFVLVEKPLALTKEGVHELILTEKKSNALLMMGFNHRYWLPALKLKEKLSVKKKIISAEIVFTGDYSKWNPVSFQSDPLNDLGPHVFDLVRFIFNKKIISVKAESARGKSLNVKIKLEDDLIIDSHIAHCGKTEKTINVVTDDGKYSLLLGSERIAPEINLRRKLFDLKDRVKRKILRQASPVKRTFELQLKDFFNLVNSKKIEYAGINGGISAIIAVNGVKDSIKYNGKEICLNEAG
ncbi:MAG TPA: Gfo/Idh/MocA family oxidoreductase [Ignavibacteriaceae bacterium]|nr:Gfo/Idh/MocA family oxidoreductase [Ignavibacteriaceae bacterium]